MHPQFCLASDQARATLWSFSSYPHDWAPVGCVAPHPGCSNSPWVRASAAAQICCPDMPPLSRGCSCLQRPQAKLRAKHVSTFSEGFRSIKYALFLIFITSGSNRKGGSLSHVSQSEWCSISPGIAGRVRERLSLPASMALAPGMAAYSNTHTDRALQSAYRGSRSVRFG